MNDFIKAEIKNLNKLKHVAVFFILCLNFGIIFWFLYAFYQSYKESNGTESFFDYSIKTICLLQLMLLIFFAPLLFFIYRRLFFTNKQLKDLNTDFAVLYKEYCQSTPRLFSEIPKYIISQKGLIIIGNFKDYILDENQYNKIVIKRIDAGRFGKKCFVKVY